MITIGITGGTGAGKTSALHALSAFDACIMDADAVYHALTRESKDLRQELEARFGSLYTEGELDRKKLGSLVFGDARALLDLNAITHRYVGERIDAQLAQARIEGKRVAAIDAIALLESGLHARCDATLAIIAPIELRVRRIMAREGISEEYARARIAAQKSEAYFREHCDYILESVESDTLEIFSQRALALFHTILAEQEIKV